MFSIGIWFGFGFTTLKECSGNTLENNILNSNWRRVVKFKDNSISDVTYSNWRKGLH